MTAIKIIAYIAAGILIFFGVLFIWAAFGTQFNAGWLITGLITVGIGFALIAGGYFMGRRASAEAAQNVTYKVDLPANVSVDAMKCQACGGALTMDNIKMVAGAPIVTCPYCNTTYQLTEDPKW
jgi:hypothetical protein